MILTQNRRNILFKFSFSLIIALFLLFLPTFSSAGVYESVGNDQYVTGLGDWNTNAIDSSITGVVGLSNPENMPMVSDLDNNDVNEIILLANDNLIIFADKELTVVDTYTIAPAPNEYSNLEIFDIDGDGFKEIILAGASTKLIYIFKFNGTDILLNTSFDFTKISRDTILAPILSCYGVEDCAIVMTHVSEAPASIYASYFNSTNATNNAQYIHAFGSGQLCQNRIKSLPNADIDGDGFGEYVITYTHINNNIYIATFSINSSGILVIENQEAISGAYPDDAFGTCTGVTDTDDMVTPPLIAEVDSLQGGLEILVGYQTDADHFKINVYAYDLTLDTNCVDFECDVFPWTGAGFSADGVLISNVFLMDAFLDASEVRDDFCVLGYDVDDNLIDLVCGSKSTGDFTKYKLFDVGVSYDLADTRYNHNIIAHATDQTRTPNEGTKDLDEVSSSYGTLWLDYSDDDCNSVLPDCELQILWSSPIDDSVLYFIDYENISKTDVLSMTQSNLRYIDDGFTNSRGKIIEYCFNPNILDFTAKVNTTLWIDVTVNDTDGDNVFAFSSIYNNLYNQTSIINFSSGGTYRFIYVLNETGTSVLRLEGYDIVNPKNAGNTFDIPYSVASSGIENGDSVSCIVIDSTDGGGDTGDGTDEADSTDNAIKNAIDDVTFGSNLGYGIIWLLIMAILGVGIAISMKSDNIGIVAPIVIFVEMIALVIGVKLGFLGVGTVIVISLIAVVTIIGFAYKLLFGQN